MSNTSSGTGLPTRRNDEKQNLPPLEQSESKLPGNELRLIRKLPQQIKEIVEQNARIERQLQGMNKDIKQISQTHPDKAESRESMKQIQSQIAQLQTHVTKVGNAVDKSFVNIKSKKKGKKKGKKSKKK
jgi:flagellar biosynthesis chaperone FliJ